MEMGCSKRENRLEPGWKKRWTMMGVGEGSKCNHHIKGSLPSVFRIYIFVPLWGCSFLDLSYLQSSVCVGGGWRTWRYSTEVIILSTRAGNWRLAAWASTHVLYQSVASDGIISGTLIGPWDVIFVFMSTWGFLAPKPSLFYFHCLFM